MTDRLAGRVALVSGASRGLGKAIALELAAAGAHVVCTGRSTAQQPTQDKVPGLTIDAVEDEIQTSGGSAEAVRCDHTDPSQVDELIRAVQDRHGRLDILVNNAWGGYEQMVDAAGRFTWPLPFWEQPAVRWDLMIDAGVRAAFVASQHAARQMVADRRGLIVNVSFWAAQKYLRNVIYGIAKAATDKLTFDAAQELRPHNVTIVSLYPCLVKTEAVIAAGVFDLSRAESPEFVGRAVAALASDPDVARWSGQVVVAAALAQHYDFTDIDGARPPALTLADV
jgi:NAD(P)-dependent dehydrogenase (short-subunit alcohol dehydrogenase family)